MAAYEVGILTVSDRCSNGEAEDKSGPKLSELVRQKLGQDWVVKCTKIVPDEIEEIKKSLIEWTDQGLALVLTTGGTGFSPRDVTPEATKAVIEREAPGLVHAMMAGSLAVTRQAMLSRMTAGIRGKSLIVNLPGNMKGSSENFEFLVPALKHGIDVLQDNKNKVEKNHQVDNGHTCHHHHHHENNVNVASRPRKSPYPMITVQEAQAIVLHHCQNPIGIEEISFRQALGRVLAEDVLAKDPLPPFPASVKDGYAVLSSDKAGTRIVIGSSNAGNSPGQVLQAGQCVRINTGAPVPIGADAVVQVEDTELTKKSDDGKEEFEIEILEAPTVGQDIRPIGSDIQDGSVVLSKGSILGPAEIGLLATVGSTRLKGFKKPIIALLSTGNELQDPDQADLKPGFIRDSNKTTLWSLLDMEQGFSTVDCGIANDDLGDLKAKLTFALDHGDMIVTTGGVSMGDKDLLRQVLVQDFSAHIHFGRVLMKPGKPTTFATLTWKDKSKLILGLPGNPVSATVTSHLYVLPAARALSGYKKPFAATVKARLTKDLVLDPRPEYQRVALYWNGQDSVSSSEATGNQISSRLASLRAANALLILPPSSEEKKTMLKGDIVDAMIIGNLLQ